MKCVNQTLKNDSVLPPASKPYLILFCFAKSSTLSILASILTMVKKAAMLAVYDDITIRAKNQKKPVAKRVGIALDIKITCENYPTFSVHIRYQFSYFGRMSHPCCMILPTINQIQLCMFQMFSSSTGFSSHGCGFSQSADEILNIFSRI